MSDCSVSDHERLRIYDESANFYEEHTCDLLLGYKPRTPAPATSCFTDTLSHASSRIGSASTSVGTGVALFGGPRGGPPFTGGGGISFFTLDA